MYSFLHGLVNRDELPALRENAGIEVRHQIALGTVESGLHAPVRANDARAPGVLGRVAYRLPSGAASAYDPANPVERASAQEEFPVLAVGGRPRADDEESVDLQSGEGRAFPDEVAVVAGEEAGGSHGRLDRDALSAGFEDRLLVCPEVALPVHGRPAIRVKVGHGVVKSVTSVFDEPDEERAVGIGRDIAQAVDSRAIAGKCRRFDALAATNPVRAYSGKRATSTSGERAATRSVTASRFAATSRSETTI